MTVNKATSTIRGMTIFEVIMAMVLLGVLLGSVAQGVSLSIRLQRSTAERIRGELLATDLLELINTFPYSDPDGGAVFGIDEGEDPADRSTFDDIDDFNGWAEDPPLAVDNVVRADLPGWKRRVSVVWVTLGDTEAVEISETGIKKVVVTVTYGEKEVASIERFRFREASLLME